MEASFKHDLVFNSYIKKSFDRNIAGPIFGQLQKQLHLRSLFTAINLTIGRL